MLRFPSCRRVAGYWCTHAAGGRLAHRVQQRSTLRADVCSRIFPEAHKCANRSDVHEGAVSESIRLQFTVKPLGIKLKMRHLRDEREAAL